MADLTLTITESVTLNGSARGSTNTSTISGINNVYHRILSCPSGQSTTVAVFNSTVHGAAGAIDLEDVRHIRVTNLDSSNGVYLGVVGASDNYQVTMGAGVSHVLGGADDAILGETDTTPAFSSFEDIASLICKPAGDAAISVEVFIASV